MNTQLTKKVSNEDHKTKSSEKDVEIDLIINNEAKHSELEKKDLNSTTSTQIGTSELTCKKVLFFEDNNLKDKTCSIKMTTRTKVNRELKKYLIKKVNFNSKKDCNKVLIKLNNLKKQPISKNIQFYEFHNLQNEIDSTISTEITSQIAQSKLANQNNPLIKNEIKVDSIVEYSETNNRNLNTSIDENVQKAQIDIDRKVNEKDSNIKKQPISKNIQFYEFHNLHREIDSPSSTEITSQIAQSKLANQNNSIIVETTIKRLKTKKTVQNSTSSEAINSQTQLINMFFNMKMNSKNTTKEVEIDSINSRETNSKEAQQHTILIMRRENGKENFFRNWNDYKNGFGSKDQDFWIGNQTRIKLRFKLHF
jgi:hypothetical protein